MDDGGAGDRAFLHGSVGNDRFVSRPDSSYLTGIGFYNQARDFDKVYAYASGDAGGLRDRAFLYDSAGNDQFYGRKAFSYLTGAGFFNQASGFDSVFAFATAGDDGGVGDQAFFYDSKLNDTFFGRGPNAQLTGLGFLIFAKGFDSVDAYAYNGGFDTIDNRWLNYDFFQHGDWEKIL